MAKRMGRITVNEEGGIIGRLRMNKILLMMGRKTQYTLQRVSPMS